MFALPSVVSNEAESTINNGKLSVENYRMDRVFNRSLFIAECPASIQEGLFLAHLSDTNAFQQFTETLPCSQSLDFFRRAWSRLPLSAVSSRHPYGDRYSDSHVSSTGDDDFTSFAVETDLLIDRKRSFYANYLVRDLLVHQALSRTSPDSIQGPEMGTDRLDLPWFVHSLVSTEVHTGQHKASIVEQVLNTANSEWTARGENFINSKDRNLSGSLSLRK